MNLKSLMARTVLTLLFLSAWATAVHAGDGYFGFQGGIVLANMGGDMEQVGQDLAEELENEFGGDWTASKESRTGFVGGLTYTKMFKPTVGIQIEGMYASRGVKFDLATSGLAIDTQLKLNYLEFPILLRYAPSPEARTQIVLLVGPVVGFETSSKIAVSALGQSQDTDLEGVKSVAFGATGAVALRFAVGEKNALLLQARYHLGLSNAIDDPQYSTSANDLMFLAGMEFPLGK